MPATAMFSKLKHGVGGGGGASGYLENNAIGQYFEIGKHVSSAGPEMVWKIHDGVRRSDGKPIFLNIPGPEYPIFLNIPGLD
ncbi:hypothetical protein M8J76_015444 [Diaphorina citri]|nr:hypothetical protein M8J76_015444 [Diaphorina citri]